MSLVVVPFLHEDPEVVARTLTLAASHPRVVEVVGVYCEPSPIEAVRAMVDDSIRLMPQQRIGSLREGKGDATNTGLRYFLEETDHERVHFFDGDIRTFEAGWIERAERTADQGYPAVRHYYPRAATDGMITWMVTKTGLALSHPGSVLTRIRQPLAGELMFTRRAASTLWTDQRIRRQSDWGIDTMLTFVSVQSGLPIAEVYEEAGKDHALYGALTDLKVMACECLAVLQRIRGCELPASSDHWVEPAILSRSPVVGKVAYDLEATIDGLGEPWRQQELALLDRFPDRVAKGLAGLERWPVVGFMDEEAWWEFLTVALDGFQLGNTAWENVFFRGFTCRVLDYTLRVALTGHEKAMSSLEQMISEAELWGSQR